MQHFHRTKTSVFPSKNLITFCDMNVMRNSSRSGDLDGMCALAEGCSANTVQPNHLQIQIKHQRVLLDLHFSQKQKSSAHTMHGTEILNRDRTTAHYTRFSM